MKDWNKSFATARRVHVENSEGSQLGKSLNSFFLSFLLSIPSSSGSNKDSPNTINQLECGKLKVKSSFISFLSSWRCCLIFRRGLMLMRWENFYRSSTNGLFSQALSCKVSLLGFTSAAKMRFALFFITVKPSPLDAMFFFFCFKGSEWVGRCCSSQCHVMVVNDNSCFHFIILRLFAFGAVNRCW